MDVDKADFYSFLRRVTRLLKVNDATSFFKDVGMTGVEAEYMMKRVAEKYNVNLAAYDPAQYHDGGVDLPDLLYLLPGIIEGKPSRFKTFTAPHLYNVVQVGRWFSPESNP